MIHVFITTALLLFIAELGDKTMISTITIALATGKYYSVLFASTLGFILASLIVAYGGYFLQSLIDPIILRLIASLLFIALGLWIYLANDQSIKEHENLGLLSCLLIIFLSEMGDKTQLVVLSSSILWTNPALIVSASALGYLSSNIVGLLVARSISSRVSWSILKRAVSLIMVSVGFIVLVATLVS